jgi:hypothetical protein
LLECMPILVIHNMHGLKYEYNFLLIYNYFIVPVYLGPVRPKLAYK